MSSKTRTRIVAPCRGINAVGASIPSARFHTTQRRSLAADRRTFVLWLTDDQREARYQATSIDAARRRNERKTNGLIMPIGAEW